MVLSIEKDKAKINSLHLDETKESLSRYTGILSSKLFFSTSGFYWILTRVLRMSYMQQLRTQKDSLRELGFLLKGEKGIPIVVVVQMTLHHSIVIVKHPLRMGNWVVVAKLVNFTQYWQRQITKVRPNVEFKGKCGQQVISADDKSIVCRRKTN